jgi:hypothetical protein
VLIVGLGRKGIHIHNVGESVYDNDHLSTLSEHKPEEDACSATVQGSSGSQKDDHKQDDAAITLVHDSGDDRNSSSSMSSSPLIKSAECARTAREVQVTSHLKAVRKVSNLRKTASFQHVGAPPEPITEIALPEPITQITSPEAVTEIKLISLPEARERERHASKMRAIRLVSTSSLSESALFPAALKVKHDPKVSNYQYLEISAKYSQDTKPNGRLSKIPVYALFSNMVNRRREKKEKPKLPIRPITISSPKRISPYGRTPVGSIANRQNKYQKLPPTPPMSPPAAARKTPMDRHRDMMMSASNLRQDARLVASQMDDSTTKLELLRALEASLNRLPGPQKKVLIRLAQLFNDTVMNSANALAAAESARAAPL